MDLSAPTLFASLVVSSVGLGLFLYGKKQVRHPQLATGLAMMLFPYFVAGPLMLWGTAGALGALLFVALRLGM